MTLKEKSKLEKRFVLAFYGLDGSQNAAEGFFRTTTEWFRELGYSPDQLGVTGKGFGDKVGSFRRLNSRLEKTGFADVQGFSIRKSKSEALNSMILFDVSAIFSGADDDGGYGIVAVPSPIASKPVWGPIAEKIIQSLHPNYGIGYERMLGEGPTLYALGINLDNGTVRTGEAYEQALNVSKWCYCGMPKRVYHDGLLRDVYPWNFLTQSQLTRQVGELPLADWIRQDETRGSLSEFCNGVSLWEIPEPNIPAVRRVLWDAGAIFDWKRFLPPQGKAASPDDFLRTMLEGKDLEQIDVISGRTGKKLTSAEVRNIIDQSASQKK